MTVNYSKSASFEIRSFLWEKLKEYNLLDENDYIADGFTNPLIPIIPSQQVPEFNNLIGDKPYIVYDIAVENYEPDAWWVCQESMLFSIVSTDYLKIFSITNAMIDLFRRMDDSAKDLNIFLGVDDTFKFYNLTVNMASAPSPFEEEGGRQIGQIEIMYRYSRNLDSGGRFL